MSERSTRVSTDLDLHQNGKQVTQLRVPYSRNRSAWGAVLIPIVCIRNGDGPTILLTAGAHGDEYEGPITLSKLARELEPDAVNGRVIVLPAMNLPGIRAATRLSPIDGRDLNRSFPGDQDGSPTQVLAHYIDAVLLPHVDAVVDFHSGGYSLEFVPCIIMHHLRDAAQRAKTMAALQAFGAPTGLVIEELDDRGTLDSLVENKGPLFLTTELAGGGAVCVDALHIAQRGAWNLLAHFGSIDPTHPKRQALGADAEQTRLFEVPSQANYVLADQEGVFEPFVRLGEWVAKNQAVGQLHFLGTPHRAPEVLYAGVAGMLLAKRAPGHTEAGDCLAVLGADHTQQTL